MPIRINLLAEAQAAEELRRRDPVKRAIWAGSLLVVLVLGWAGVLQLRILSARAELAENEARWTSIEKDYDLVREQQKQIGVLNRKLAALDRFSTNRFLWGTVLDVLQQTVVENVELTRLSAQQTFRVTEPVAPRETAGRTVPGKPGFSVERVNILIEARDHQPARQNYNAYRAALAQFPYLANALQRSDAIRLTGLGQPVSNPADPGRSFVPFTLECQFPEVRRDE